MYDSQWDLKQSEQLTKLLQQLPVELRGKAGRSAAGKAMRIVTTAAQAGALALDDPSTSEQISKNVTQRFNSKYARQTGDIMIRVGVLGGARDYSAYGELVTGRSASANPGGDTFYWRFLEFGTVTARAQEFMQPALGSNVASVEQKFATELSGAITRIVKKLRP